MMGNFAKHSTEHYISTPFVMSCLHFNPLLLLQDMMEKKNGCISLSVATGFLTLTICTEYEIIIIFYPLLWLQETTNGSEFCLSLHLSNYSSASRFLCKCGARICSSYITLTYLSFVWQCIVETNALLMAKTLMRNEKFMKKMTIKVKASLRLPPSSVLLRSFINRPLACFWHCLSKKPFAHLMKGGSFYILPILQKDGKAQQQHYISFY